MKNNDVELLFEDDEDVKVNNKVEETSTDEEFVKDPSLENVFPDKKDIDIDRLLNKFED